MSTTEAPDPPSAGMELLTLEDAAAFLGPSFGVRWLRRQVDEFGLPSFVVNRKRVIRKRDLVTWIEAWEKAERAKANARGRRIG